MSKKVDFYAQQPHYFDHMFNIWNQLPNEYKGIYYIPEFYLHDKNFDLCFYADKFNIETSVIKSNQPIYSPLILAGGVSGKDIGNSNIILVNHGAGQSYIRPNRKRHSSYAGGEGRDKVVLFIQPNTYAANLDRNRYPKATQAITGCCKLDKWHQRKLSGDIKKREDIPVIAISFHWDCRVCNETRSTWEYYQSILPMLGYKNATKEWKVLGHGHPGIMHILKPYYEKEGIEIVECFEDVMERADLYIMDHMSTLYEFASTDRPVVVLNAPWYRRHVEHGLRYWEYADVGINCDHPNILEKCIMKALDDPLEQKMKRERACNAVYAHRDGMATDRAVQAIIDFVEQRDEKPQNNITSENMHLNTYKHQQSKWFRNIRR